MLAFILISIGAFIGFFFGLDSENKNLEELKILKDHLHDNDSVISDDKLSKVESYGTISNSE